jgi:Tol biopolymer transport system component
MSRPRLAGRRRPAAGLALLLATSGTVGAGTPAVADGALVLVSTTSDGAQGTGPSGTYGVSVSANGSVFAFGSSATGLSEDDPDAEVDVYVRDLSSGALTLASTSSEGVKASTFSLRPSLDGAGDTVAFMSAAENLSPQDEDNVMDVFVKDLRSDELVLASTGEDGTTGKGNADSSSPALSADGRRVAFVSRADNLAPADTDGAPDVYVKDLLTGALQVVSRPRDGAAGVPGPYGTGAPSISADGLWLAFDTDAALVPEDDDTAPDVYVADATSGELQLASVSAEGCNSQRGSYRPSLSADGARVSFDSFSADLSPDDTEEDGDVFVKDLSTGALEVASTTLDGNGVDGRATDASLSGDGRRVAFASDAALGPVTATGTQTWVKDLDSGAVRLVSVDAGGAPATAVTIAPRLSADAGTVVFATPSALVPWDVNGWADVYARRLGGGPPPPPEDTEAPSLTLDASPDVFRGSEGRVTISGTAVDDHGIGSLVLTVVDEYGQVIPVPEPVEVDGGSPVEWTRTVLLPGRVRWRDHDGRDFSISATATDVSGNTATTHVHVTALARRDPPVSA